MFEVPFYQYTTSKLACWQIAIVISGRLYQILNLNLFMPIYHYCDVLTTAAYFVNNWTNTQKHFTVGVYYLANIINLANFPCLRTEYMFVLSQIKKINPRWFFLNRRIGIQQYIYIKMV